jgi:hypothetical protein
VLLVLPGLAFELFRQRRRWGRNDSTFVEISRVLVAGVGLGGLTFTLLAGVSLVGPRSIISMPGLVTNKHWLVQHLLVDGWTAWAYGLVSVTLAAFVAAIMPGPNKAGSIYTESSWVTCFDRVPRAMQEAMRLRTVPGVRLSVRLADGTVYVGDRVEYSTDLPLEDRELVLGGQLAYRPAGKEETKLLPRWQRLLVRGDQISDMLVQYVPGVEPAGGSYSAPPRCGWLRQACARFLGRPADSTWPKLLEAPVTHATAAARLLGAELGILLAIAIVSLLT